MPIHLAQEAQIALLVIKEMQIPFKYLDILDIVLEKKILVLLAVTKINQNGIKLQEAQ